MGTINCSVLFENSVDSIKRKKGPRVPSIYWKMKYRLISRIQKETLVAKQNIAILEVFKLSHRSERLQMTGYGRQSWDIMILGNNKSNFVLL